jgi:hypothetical protein
LSDELYSKSTHFVFEFVQNADDNSYDDSVVRAPVACIFLNTNNFQPTLHMQIADSEASFHCNEVGFTRENVEAICRVGASTKKNVRGYIGKSPATLLEDHKNNPDS